MNLAQIQQKTLELLGDAAEGSSTFVPNGDYTNLNAAIQWAQEQAATELGLTFFFESSLPVVAQAPPVGMPTTPGAYGGVAIPSDCIELVRVAIGVAPSSGTLVAPQFLFTGISMEAYLSIYTSTDEGTWTSPDDSVIIDSGQGTTRVWVEPQTGYTGGATATLELSVTGGKYSGQNFTQEFSCWDPNVDFEMTSSSFNPNPNEEFTVSGQNLGFPGGTLNGSQPGLMNWSSSSNCTLVSGQNTDVVTFSVNSDANPGDQITIYLEYIYVVVNTYTFSAPNLSIPVGSSN